MTFSLGLGCLIRLDGFGLGKLLGYIRVRIGLDFIRLFRLYWIVQLIKSNFWKKCWWTLRQLPTSLYHHLMRMWTPVINSTKNTSLQETLVFSFTKTRHCKVRNSISLCQRKERQKIDLIYVHISKNINILYDLYDVGWFDLIWLKVLIY